MAIKVTKKVGKKVSTQDAAAAVVSKVTKKVASVSKKKMGKMKKGSY